jgi:hypothetical protein
MSTTVLNREPAQHRPAPVRGRHRAALTPSSSALCGALLAARAEALFTSDLSARREYTQIEVAAAISRAIGVHNGIRGCLGEVAAAYGEYPETAARRMRWARTVIEGIYASRPAGAST